MSQEAELISYQFNSVFRSSGTISAPEFLLPEAIHNIYSVKLRNFVMPLTTPLIDSRNNKIYFRETTSGSILTATLTSGNYIALGSSSNSITTQVKAALQAASTLTWTYNVSFNAIDNKLTISTTNGNFSLTSGINDCYYELGYTSDSLNTFASSQVGIEPIDLSGVKIIHIGSNIKASKVFSKNVNLLASVILDEQLSQIATYDDQSSDYVLAENNMLSSIRFQFYDDRFRNLTLSKDFSITINIVVDK